MNKGSTILVADDDLEIAALLRTTLEAEGFRVVLAHDGQAALAVAQQQRPDLIVLDVMMPQMSGWEVCRALRADPDLGDVRIVMLTAIGPGLNDMTAPVFGADAHLDKPFVVSELIECVERLLRRPEAS
jgi:two-component system phosphate regulon response regulator PhoB